MNTTTPSKYNPYLACSKKESYQLPTLHSWIPKISLAVKLILNLDNSVIEVNYKITKFGVLHINSAVIIFYVWFVYVDMSQIRQTVPRLFLVYIYFRTNA